MTMQRSQLSLHLKDNSDLANEVFYNRGRCCYGLTPPAPASGWTSHATFDFGDGSVPSVFRAYGNGYNDIYGSSNNQLEAEVPSQVKVAGGVLQLWADRRIISTASYTRHFAGCFLGTRDTNSYFPAFARFEFNARFPQGQGLWPAIWLRHHSGAPNAEVDIMEEFHSQHYGTQQTLHFDNYARNPGMSYTSVNISEWHIHAVEIQQLTNNSVSFKFFVDNTNTFSYVDNNPTWVPKAPLNETWDIALNFAVGGKWAGDPDELQLGQLHTSGTVYFDPNNATHREYQGSTDRCARGGTYPSCTSTGIQRAVFPAVSEFAWLRVLVPGTNAPATSSTPTSGSAPGSATAPSIGSVPQASNPGPNTTPSTTSTPSSAIGPTGSTGQLTSSASETLFAFAVLGLVFSLVL